MLKLKSSALWLFAGITVGLIAFALHASNFFSYLSDHPRTCMNCHIMGPEYATWFHSAHRESATCNDCHVPHDHWWRTYLFKAIDGLRHAAIYTFKAEPQAIIIKEAGRQAVHENCQRCHAHTIGTTAYMIRNNMNFDHNRGQLCWHCHRDTPHGLVRSLSATPLARVPTTTSVIPEWLRPLQVKEKK